MLHTKFSGNRHTRSGEENFEEFSPYAYGHGGHPGHVTSIMSSNIQFLYLKAFIQNLVQNGTAVFEKIWFDFKLT